MKRLAVGSVDLWRWVVKEHKMDYSYSKDGLNFMHLAAGYADTVLLEELKAGGASITELDSNDISPLFVACGLGNREAICWFMENGAREGSESKRDPILYAIRERAPESVSCLIEYGVNVNRDELAGVSPIMYAAGLREKEITETLLSAGAVWNFESRYSDACLRDAVRMDSPKLLEGLLEQGLDIDHRILGEARLWEVAKFYGSEKTLAFIEERQGPNEAKLVTKRPEVAQRTNIEYPFELQEKYGDIDAIVRLGIMNSGRVGMIEVDDGVPSEIEELVEENLLTWVFRPLEFEDADTVGVVKFKFPLKMSIQEKDVIEVGKVHELPRAIYQVEPYYPYLMKQFGVKGYVNLEWVIDKEGVVRFPKVVKSSHRDFEEPAIASIRLSRWRPAKIDGVPVNVRVTQRMDFNP